MNYVNFFGHQVSKLIIGDNPFTGHSYIEDKIPGSDMVKFYTAEKIKNLYPEIEFEIAGSYEEDYKEAVEQKEKAGVIRFLGYQKIMHPFYKEASAILMPSYHEGMSNVILEASATGRPVLASDIPGCREGFEVGKTGFGFMARDKEACYETVKKFVGLSYEERRKMGKNARKKMEQEFDRKKVVDSYLEEIQKVM